MRSEGFRDRNMMSPAYFQQLRKNMHICKNRETTKASEAKYKQSVDLHNGNMEVSCTVFANIFVSMKLCQDTFS